MLLLIEKYMYSHSTSSSFHFTIDSLRNICFREEEKKENGEERTWWGRLKRWNMDGKDGYLPEWKTEFKWKGKKSYGGTNCSNTANLKRMRGEARRLHERQRGRGGKWGGGRGAYNSEWQAEKERQRREWERGKVAGEIREWQDEGLNDGGEGGQEGDGLKSRDTELWGYMSKREGREAGEMSEWFDVLQ